MKTPSILFEKFGMRRFASALGAFLLWSIAVFAMIAASAQAQAQVNAAEFVSQSVPASMTAGQTYAVSVTMKNTGTTIWTSANAYKLGSQNPGDNSNFGLNRVGLTASVAPGAQHTFSFNVTAPTTAGTYNFQWRMLREFVEWFGPTSTNVAVVVSAPQVNGAEFVSQSVPASMTAGQTYAVSVTMKNTGTTTWTSANAYKLGSQNPGDNNNFGLNRVGLTASVAPGAQYTFSFNVTAPTTPGTYNFQWRMLREFVEWFGPTSTNVAVVVNAPQINGAEFVSQSVPASMTAGQTYAVSVTMKNTGTTTWTSANAYKLGAQNPADNKTWTSTGRVELTASVAPGQQHTFSFTVTAPATAGTYNFQWRMIREFVEWFGPASTNVAVAVSGPAVAPTINVQRTPSSMVAGQSFTVSWSTTNATSVSQSCTASGTGFNGNATLSANGSSTGTANAAWVGYPSTCTWTATGPGGNKTFTETMTTVAATAANAAEFVSQSVPTSMTSGQTYNVSVTMKNIGTATWTSANAYKLGSQNPADNKTWTSNGRVELTASVAPGQQYTFSFAVTAPATGGTYNFQWKMIREFVEWFGPVSTNVAVSVAGPAAAPTISVSRTPSPMVAGQSFTVSWSTTNATSVSQSCTASGTGFNGNATLGANGSSTGTANAAWVGYPSTCTWTATGPGGNKTFTETMTTVAAPAGETITYFHNDVSGTPLVASDTNGNVVWKENYRPYGDKLNKQAASSNNKLWFTGKPYDDNTGLSYIGARYYDPMLGRFMGVDPVDFQENNIHSFNRYVYGNNNPYRFIDRDGRAAETIVDVISLGLSIAEFRRDPSFVNGLGVAYDAAATVVPFVPAGAGIVKNAAKTANALGNAGGAAKKADNFVDLTTAQRRKHILDGDATGGGHGAGRGVSGKSEFPQGWSDDKAIHSISDIATDPNATRTIGRGGRAVVEGVRDGINIRVIVGKNGEIITGFPTNVPRNP